MKVVIIEDEAPAAERLSDLIRRHDPAMEVVACLDSVREAVAWFVAAAEPPDLAFFDIQLADGLSFDIFRQCRVPCPVIFTTAYDEYALRAFKVNSIDYLLKPIDAEDLRQAFAKLETLKSAFAQKDDSAVLQTMQEAIRALQKPAPKNRFVVKSGAQLLSIPAADILYFFHEDKIVWLRRNDRKKYAVDFTLDQLESLLDPARFFRLNRQMILSFPAIAEVVAHSNSRLKIKLTDNAEPAIVSRERVGAFRAWFGE
jgi:DNA-binding LytR/AlgR family response regulator